MSTKLTDRILVPFDGSKFSQKGLEQAIQISKEKKIVDLFSFEI